MNHCSLCLCYWRATGRSVRLGMRPLWQSVYVTKWSKMSASLRRSITTSADILLTDRRSCYFHQERRAERERKCAHRGGGGSGAWCARTLRSNHLGVIGHFTARQSGPGHSSCDSCRMHADKTRFSRLLLRFFTCHLGQHVNKLRRRCRCLDTSYTFTLTCLPAPSLILKKGIAF